MTSETHDSFRASTMGIDRRTVEEIGRLALHVLDYRLDISPNDWKASLEDLHRFAAICSFPSESGYTRTVVNNILDKLKVNAPPGIPLRARTGFSEQGSTEPPSLTDISGIFTGAGYSPRIILKAAEARPAVPWNVPNDSIVGCDTRKIGQRMGDEHLLNVSMRHPGIRSGQSGTTGGRVVIEHSMRLETQFFSTQGTSAGNRQTFWPSDDAQRIQPDDGSFGMQGDTWNGPTVRHGAAMMVGRHIRSDMHFLETQRPPLVSRSAQDHRMIWQSDNRISRQRTVAGGLIFRGPNEDNIWALQRGEYPGDGWFTRQGNQIASRTSLRW